MSQAMRTADSIELLGKNDRYGLSVAPLLGKELLQLAPLLTAVVGVSAVLGLMQWYSPIHEAILERYQGRTEFIVLMLPLLFCVGAGPVMVGMERETRTLRWLQMMPISPRRIIATKAAVALAVFSILWVAAMLMTSWLGVDRPISTRLSVSDANVDLNGVHWTVWWSRCIAILAASFFTAWKIRNPFGSLVALIGFLCVPSVIVWLLSAAGIFEAERVHWNEITVTLVFVWGTTLCLAWAAYRAGLGVMLPQNFDRQTMPNPITAIAKLFSGQYSLEFHSPLAALTWQSARSMAAVWCILVGLLLLTLVTDIYTRSTNAPWKSVYTTLAVSGAIASWIGVSVFQFSGSARSLRRISLIGHAPWRVYLARHLIPASILCTAIAVYTLMATAAGGVVNQGMGVFEPLPSLLQVTLAVGLIYCISQWISQCISVAAIAYFAAPLISLPIAALLVLSTFFQSTPRIILFMVCPLVMTGWMMRKYLSVSLSVARKVFSAVVICGLFVLSIRTSSSDSLDLSRAEWARATTANGDWKDPEWSSYPLITSKWLRSDQAGVADSTDSDAFSVASSGDDSQVSLLFQNGDKADGNPERPLSMDTDSAAILFSRLMLERNIYRSEGRNEFLESVRWTGHLVNGLRQSTRWLDQEIADRLELWLVETITDANLGLDRQDAKIAELIDQLPSRTERNRLRRRAITTSYFELLRRPQAIRELVIGGLLIDRLGLATDRYGAGPGFPRIPDLIISAALKALQSDSEVTNEADWQKDLHRETVSSLIPFSLGPYSSRSRAQTGLAFHLPLGAGGSTPVFPSRWVGLPWESNIERLKAERSISTVSNETSKP